MYPDDQQAAPPAPFQTTLPSSGEALIPMKVFADALGVSEATGWEWLRTDPAFPQPIRRGERFTRFRLSDARGYIAGLGAGTPKESPNKRRKSVAE